VLSALAVFLAAAILTAAAAFWVLRAYRRAGGGSRTAFPALTACAVVALAALGGYLMVGSPELAGASYRDRLEALKQRDPSTYSVEDALAILHEAARDNPRDALPHFYTGQLLLDQNRPQEAARAFDAALRREPELAEAMLGLGRALVRIENGRVTPEALALFEQAAAYTDDPAPWIYQAMAAMEENREADARRLWGEALARMAADDPRREMARRMSRGAGR
jgi:cytochrome c-type biogenesis protein CcmH